MKLFPALTCTLLLLAPVMEAQPKLLKKKPVESPVDKYVREADGRVAIEGATPSIGSTWSNYSALTDLTRDPRASRVDDVVSIVVAESASAVSTGLTKTARQSSANASISGLGIKGAAATALLSNLATLNGNNSLNGQGTTSRTTTLNTQLTARVTHVLPNGFLLVEGTKNVQVNSEWQTVSVRGVVRPTDLAADNTVPSWKIAQLDVKLDGKGVVNDAIRRPNFLYRALMGLLPF